MSSVNDPVNFALTRRHLLRRASMGFGGLAAAALFGNAAAARQTGNASRPHHRPKVKSVIFLYMDGAPSQVDTFDPKPRLAAENGQPIGMEIPKTQFDNVGSVLQSPWTFRPGGESGLPISDLFPKLRERADELCIVRSMTSQFPEHTSANYFLHTGFGGLGRPSIGAWAQYGLGRSADDLPGYVVLNGGLIPPGGLDTFGSGFLPASFQASLLRPSDPPVADVAPIERFAGHQRRKLDLLAELDANFAERYSGEAQVDAAIENWETAARMQTAVPEVFDLSGESQATRELYGLDAEFEHTRTYARQCLLARRLVERGVRFIELTCPNCGHDRWDQHSNLKNGHEANARAVDQPIAALLGDLRRRGLLEDTLVLFAGEFGRTPMAQGSNGRDHNPHGYSIWLAGGGVQGGQAVGATDDYGYFAVDQRCDMHDLHATVLHLLGFDHTRLTFRFGGRDMRLTDVHGVVQDAWLA